MYSPLGYTNFSNADASVPANLVPNIFANSICHQHLTPLARLLFPYLQIIFRGCQELSYCSIAKPKNRKKKIKLIYNILMTMISVSERGSFSLSTESVLPTSQPLNACLLIATAL